MAFNKDTPAISHIEPIQDTAEETGARPVMRSATAGSAAGRPWHVAHVITRLIVGGAQENTLLTCEGLVRRGWKVTLLSGPTSGPEGSLLPRANAGGYELVTIPHLVRNPDPARDFLARRELSTALATLSPDIVHTHSSKAGILGREAAWRMHKPLVIHTIHGLPFHPYQSAVARAAWTFLERRAARHCHAIFSVADAMTRQALAAGVGRPAQFTTVYSGMEIEPFLHPPADGAAVRAGLKIPREALVFGVIARLQPLKGHDDLMTIAPRLFAEAPNAHYLLIGDGAFRTRLEETARIRGMADRFTFTGLVPPEQIPALLPAMDVLVHPSYREGLARALPQAALAGKPAISYDCDGAAEACIHGETGLLVKTGDSEALLAAMLKLAGDAVLRRKFGVAGRAFCSDRFSAETMVNTISSLYETFRR